MKIDLLILAISPVLACLLWIYLKDRYEKEKQQTFTQKTDMYGGTREYSKEELDRMEEHGAKPMEHSYTGGGWEGTKYDSNLSTKDIAKNIMALSIQL